MVNIFGSSRNQWIDSQVSRVHGSAVQGLNEKETTRNTCELIDLKTLKPGNLLVN